MEKQVRTALALLVIIILSGIIIYAVLPYINYLLGGFILFVIFKPMYYFFLEKPRLNRQISAALVIIISVFVILIPLYFLLNLVISEIQQLLLDRESIMALIQSGIQLFSNLSSRLDNSGDVIQAELEGRVMDLFSEAVDYLSLLILGSIQNTGQRIIGILIMYFLLYYLLTGEDSDFMHGIFVAIPFNTENTIVLFNEFRNIVRTTIIASGAIAVIEGGILIAAFIIFGVQGAFLWGTIAGILSFLPVVGAPLIWISATVIQLLQRDYVAAIGIFVVGVLLNIADNGFFRPVIQKKVGEIHPFQSLLGIIIGVSLFGIVGIIIGPLLLAYFYLTVKMFSEEYLSSKK
jgi:predicted PurR-regulated permease PerM